jgi:hypothetical protein
MKDLSIEKKRDEHKKAHEKKKRIMIAMSRDKR